MTTITATNPEAEHLVGQLAELAAIAAPAGDVRVTVDRLGNRARPGRVFIDASTAGTECEAGAIAHEYAHVLQPDLAQTVRRIRWWYLGAPLLAGWAIFAPAAALFGDGAAWFIPAYVLLVLVFWRQGARAGQPSELQADARATELLGPERAESLVALLERSAKKVKPTSADWFMPHPNPHHRIAAIRTLIEASRGISAFPDHAQAERR